MSTSKYISPSQSKGARIAKVVISSIYALTPLALLVYRSYQGQSVDSIILMIIVIFMVASAYVIFGEDIVDKATEKADDITNEDSDETEEDSG